MPAKFLLSFFYTLKYQAMTVKCCVAFAFYVYIEGNDYSPQAP